MTRPDHDHPYSLKSLKAFLKKHDRFHILRAIHRKITSTNYRLRYGKDRTKHNPFSKIQYSNTPCIIRRTANGVGLFSYFNTILGGLSYCEKNGYIPVVDMKNYPNTYLFPDEVGHVNAWEFYFEQPGGISLEDALSCREYILGRDTMLHGWPDVEEIMSDAGKLEHWKSLCRKYIRFTPAVTERLESMKAQYDGLRILGVHVRGTDYATGKYKGHPIQPTAEHTISQVRTAMRDKNFDAVYLSTEDKNIVAKFQEAFGEKLLLPQAEYADYDGSGKGIASFHVDRDNYKYLDGLDYAVSILFLCRCEGMIASCNNGTAAAILLSDGFEYLYVFDLGRYQ